MEEHLQTIYSFKTALTLLIYYIKEIAKSLESDKLFHALSILYFIGSYFK
jgi:hypothetical protein